MNALLTVLSIQYYDVANELTDLRSSLRIEPVHACWTGRNGWPRLRH